MPRLATRTLNRQQVFPPVTALVLMSFMLVGCAHVRRTKDLFDEENRVVRDAISQLPNEPAVEPYIVDAKLALPPVMWLPEEFEVFGRRLRGSADRVSPALGYAVEDFLNKNSPTEQPMIRDVEIRNGIQWDRRRSPGLGTRGVRYQVSRPGFDQSKSTALIYVGVFSIPSPGRAYGQLYILRRQAKGWNLVRDCVIGPMWAF